MDREWKPHPFGAPDIGNISFVGDVQHGECRVRLETRHDVMVFLHEPGHLTGPPFPAGFDPEEPLQYMPVSAGKVCNVLIHRKLRLPWLQFLRAAVVLRAFHTGDQGNVYSIAAHRFQKHIPGDAEVADSADMGMGINYHGAGASFLKDLGYPGAELVSSSPRI